MTDLGTPGNDPVETGFSSPNSQNSTLPGSFAITWAPNGKRGMFHGWIKEDFADDEAETSFDSNASNRSNLENDEVHEPTTPSNSPGDPVQVAVLQKRHFGYIVMSQPLVDVVKKAVTFKLAREEDQGSPTPKKRKQV